MGTQTLRPLYHVDGRIKGTYVYMLMCREADGPIYIKIGLSGNPTARIRNLCNQCAVPPQRLAVVELHSRHAASKVERALHDSMDKWRVHGEWFKFDLKDKSRFNACWREVFDKYSRPEWQLKWEQIPLKPFLQLLAKRKKAYQKAYVLGSLAYRDFRDA